MAKNGAHSARRVDSTDDVISVWVCSRRCWAEGGPHDDYCHVTRTYRVADPEPEGEL